MIMKHSTRRTGAHRADRIMKRYAPEDRTPVSHRRGTRRAERRWTLALAETPSLPFWRAERAHVTAQRVVVPSAQEPDTMIIRRITEVTHSVTERVGRVRSAMRSLKAFPDWWIVRYFVGAVVLGFLVGIPSILPQGTLPDVPHGEYSRIVADEGIDPSWTPSAWNRALVNDRMAGR